MMNYRNELCVRLTVEAEVPKPQMLPYKGFRSWKNLKANVSAGEESGAL